MTRRDFFQVSKSILICIPFTNIMTLDYLNKSGFYNSKKSEAIFFPDKDNFLKKAICIFATPDFGDGKNGNDSLVDVIVDVECYDNLYTARGAFINDTEIEHNVVKDMYIDFSVKDAKAIFFDGIANVNITILGRKPNQDDSKNDKWNVRWEFMMEFAKGNVLATGGSDPAVEYHFSVNQTQINIISFFQRSQLFNNRTLIPGMHVG